MFLLYKKYGLLFSLALFTPRVESAVDHAIYISVIEVNHEDQSLSIKTFSDDLINALKSADHSINLDTNPCTLSSSLETYIETYLTLYINDESVDLAISDCHIESDTHWLELGYSTDEELLTMKVETDWMTDLFLNQQNIIKVNVGENRQHGRLNVEETSIEFEF